MSQERAVLRALKALRYAIEAQVVTGVLLGIALLTGLTDDVSFGLTFGFALAVLCVAFASGALDGLRKPFILYVANVSLFLHVVLAILYLLNGEPLNGLFIAFCFTGSAFTAFAYGDVKKRLLTDAPS